MNPAIAATGPFEFDAMREARNYRQALLREFGGVLRGSVIEIGAGIGQITEELLRWPGITRLVSVEPDAALCRQHRERLPGRELIEGFIDQVDAHSSWDAILSVNVLEHIEGDAEELAKYARLLGKCGGHLCLFVPARPEIYAPIDRAFGHYRRYTRPELKRKLAAAAFTVARLHYFNWVGYFTWWVHFCVARLRRFDAGKVRAFDRVIFPAVHFLESKLMRPLWGQSLLAVAKAPCAKAG